MKYQEYLDKSYYQFVTTGEDGDSYVPTKDCPENLLPEITAICEGMTNLEGALGLNGLDAWHADMLDIRDFMNFNRE